MFGRRNKKCAISYDTTIGIREEMSEFKNRVINEFREIESCFKDYE